VIVIEVFPSETESENEFRPLDGRIDEFHPKATRTLFIGNLEKTTSYQQLLDIFQRFGEIVVCVLLATERL
jgi:RNA recognition motif-containing protein